MSWFNRTLNAQATMENGRPNSMKVIPAISNSLSAHSKVTNSTNENLSRIHNYNYATNTNAHDDLSLRNDESQSYCKPDSDSFSNKLSPPQTPSGGGGDQDQCSLIDGAMTIYTASTIKTQTTMPNKSYNPNTSNQHSRYNHEIYDLSASKLLNQNDHSTKKPSPRLLEDEECECSHENENQNNHNVNGIENNRIRHNENEITDIDKHFIQSMVHLHLSNETNDRYENIDGINYIDSPTLNADPLPIPMLLKDDNDESQWLSPPPFMFNDDTDNIRNIVPQSYLQSSHSNNNNVNSHLQIHNDIDFDDIYYGDNDKIKHPYYGNIHNNKLSKNSAMTAPVVSTTPVSILNGQQSMQQMNPLNHMPIQQKQSEPIMQNNIMPNSNMNLIINNKNNNNARIYQLINMYSKRTNKNSLSLSDLIILYYKEYKEVLVKGQLLLKYLVQLPTVLLIHRKDKKDIMLFITSIPVYQIVIDILKNTTNKNDDGMTIDEFTFHLYHHLNDNLLIYECDIIDFLKRWRIVQVFNNEKYVRLNALLNPNDNKNNTNTVFFRKFKIRSME